MDDWTIFWKHALERGEAARTLGYREEDSSDSANERIQNATQALDLLLSLKLIIGFHPDQATEALIDLATVLNVPCCVVPCCVVPF